jgi:hypothetical protein
VVRLAVGMGVFLRDARRIQFDRVALAELE